MTTDELLSKATARPWKTDGDFVSSESGEVVSDGSHSSIIDYEERDANAALIVRAVNSHEALVNALRTIIYFRETDDVPSFDIWEQAAAALRLAEGEDHR